ncbi:MAG: hypothetical protein AAF939_04305 [Planctomycetota bacterium]
MRQIKLVASGYSRIFQQIPIFALLISISIFQALGCKKPSEAAVKKSKSVDVVLLRSDDFTITAERCKIDPESGAATTGGLIIETKKPFKIGSLEATVFYDHDLNDRLSKPSDGVILQIDDLTESVSDNAVIQPGPLHFAPGIGAPWLIGSFELLGTDDQPSKRQFEINLMPMNAFHQDK